MSMLKNNIWLFKLAWGYELDESLKDFWPEPTLTLNNIFWKAFTNTENTQIAGAGT